MALEMVIGSAMLDFFILGIIFVISGAVAVYFQNPLLGYFLIGLLAIIFLIGVRPVLLKKLNQKTVASNSDALIGKEGLVKSWNNQEGSGQIEVSHEVWLAKGSGSISKNDKVIVEKISGNTLLVKIED
jgi:membrane protein implicated in regulation of membrane protease activity